ncbi:hypothetical protein [Zavarzinella formosa]|uniref:hypothetical protein n=1 Tax=Zavarzinella formosa TaxID=360055 RepID=UPI0002EB796D|nr:hypothetical protein [Zavarzinella formosa]
MAEFNIQNSKIEQVNDTGDNYKITGNSAPVVVSGNDAVQTAGTNNKVQVAPSEQPSIWGKLWEKVKGWWKTCFG